MTTTTTRLDDVERRVRARRDLHHLAHMVVLASQGPDELAQSLRKLNPRAAQVVPPRELHAIAALVAAPHRS